MIAPLRQPCPHWGGGAYDAPELHIQKFSTLLCTGNTELSQLGRLSGGAEPLERQVTKMISTEQKILIAITILIKKMIEIVQTLIKK
jgi:hypothetical protein